jgi:hypothetical protein
VLAVGADLFSPLATGGAGLIGGEFVRLALLVGRAPPFAGDFPLPVGVHRGKSTIFCPAGVRFHEITDSLHPSSSVALRLAPDLQNDATRTPIRRVRRVIPARSSRPMRLSPTRARAT